MAKAGSVLRSVELFTGAGGLALATHMTGFLHRGLFEWNDDACDTLRENAKSSSIRGLSQWHGRIAQVDVRNVDFSQFDGVDLIAGGPPCQPFSLGGRHLGMEDGRDMIPEFIRAVREARPKAFIMENVRGLKRKTFSSYFNWSFLQLKFPELVRKPNESWERHYVRLQQHHTRASSRDKGLSYNVLPGVLNAADFGVPQCRDRLFIVGFRNDIDAEWNFPQPTHSQARLLHDQWVSGDYWKRVGAKADKLPDAMKHRMRSLERLQADELTKKPWRTMREALMDLPDPFVDVDHKDGIFNHRLQIGARPYPGHTGSPYDAPSKTLKAGGHGVPGGENMIDFGTHTGKRYRYLTVREAARVQTFPDAWHFKGAWSEAMRQLGNAVPVDMARAVARSVAMKLGTPQ